MFKKFTLAIAGIFLGTFAIGSTIFISNGYAEQTEEIKTINAKELKQQLDEGSVDLIDVRTTEEFLEKHIAGAKNVPLPILSLDQLSIGDKKIVIQCRSGRRGQEAYLKLKKVKPELDLYNLDGGIIAWEKEKFDTVVIDDKFPIMRQVQIIAGSLVLFGTLFGVFSTTAFLAVPIIVGAGLIFAGVTGWCGMAKLLNYMPWN